jgi:hypothetical protein
VAEHSIEAKYRINFNDYCTGRAPGWNWTAYWRRPWDPAALRWLLYAGFTLRRSWLSVMNMVTEGKTATNDKQHGMRWLITWLLPLFPQRSLPRQDSTDRLTPPTVPSTAQAERADCLYSVSVQLWYSSHQSLKVKTEAVAGTLDINSMFAWLIVREDYEFVR